MKKLMLYCVLISLILMGGYAIAGENEQETSDTIVSKELLQGRYEAPSEQKDRPEIVQKLIDQGSITTTKGAGQSKPN